MAEEGVEAFAQVIEMVLQRLKLRFTNTTIRIERCGAFPWASPAVVNQPPFDDDQMGIAVELRLDEYDALVDFP